MGIFSWLFRSRDKPKNSYHFSGWPFVFGKSAAGAKVNEFTAMQTTAVYACVRILAESIAGLPLHVYEYRGNGKASALFSSPRFAQPRNDIFYISRDGDDSPSFVGKFFLADNPGRHEACGGAVSAPSQSHER